jgi:hypothetical protein
MQKYINIGFSFLIFQHGKEPDAKLIIAGLNSVPQALPFDVFINWYWNQARQEEKKRKTSDKNHELNNNYDQEKRGISNMGKTRPK